MNIVDIIHPFNRLDVSNYFVEIYARGRELQKDVDGFPYYFYRGQLLMGFRLE